MTFLLLHFVSTKRKEKKKWQQWHKRWQKQPSFISQIDEICYQEGKSVKMDKSMGKVVL